VAATSRARRTLVAAGGIVATLAVVGAVVVGVVVSRLDGFERLDLALARISGDAPFNVLLVGSDSRDDIDPAEGDADRFVDGEVDGEVEGSRADTIIVARLDPATGAVALLSVPRDLYVPIAGTDRSDRINAAFGLGEQQLIDTVQDALDIELNHYVEIDFRGFERLVSIIGGVPVYFDTLLRDEYTGLDVNKVGCATLDGPQALAFVRSRAVEYYDPDAASWRTDPTGDLGRITRQQVFLRRVVAQIGTLGLTDIGKVDGFLEVTKDNVTFDAGLSNARILRLARTFRSVTNDDLQTSALPTEPFRTEEGADVLRMLDEEALAVLQIFRGTVGFGPGAPRAKATTVVDPDEVTVVVQNGTGVAGQGRDVADGLQLVGFVVESVGNAPRDGELRTTITYRRGNLAAAEAVARYLQQGVRFVESDSAGSNVVVTTGADYRGVLPPTLADATDAPTGALRDQRPDDMIGIAPPAVAPADASCN